MVFFSCFSHSHNFIKEILHMFMNGLLVLKLKSFHTYLKLFCSFLFLSSFSIYLCTTSLVQQICGFLFNMFSQRGLGERPANDDWIPRCQSSSVSINPLLFLRSPFKDMYMECRSKLKELWVSMWLYRYSPWRSWSLSCSFI